MGWPLVVWHGVGDGGRGGGEGEEVVQLSPLGLNRRSAPGEETGS